MRRWILEAGVNDALLLYAPGLLAVLLAQWIEPVDGSISYLLFAFVALGLLDSGHVYTTIWRTYLNPRERRRTRAYVFVPLLLFVGFFIWAALAIPYLGAFVVYATIFHNIRQLFGISKWYQKLNGVQRPTSDFFLYALSFAAVITGHFIPYGRWGGVYTERDAFLYPSSKLHATGCLVFFGLLAAWTIYEVWLWRRQGQVEWNRALSVGNAAFLYGFTFLFPKNMAQVLFPLVVSHGVAYIALISLSVRRVRTVRAGTYVTLGAIMFTALAFGAAEFLFEDRYAGFDDPSWAAVTALWLTPLFSHFVYDAFLWRRTHPEAAAVFAGPVSD